jgi:F-type H+-transporting ATPase subunit delta
VTTAVPLSETEQAEILVQLREIFKRQLRIELRIDPDLIGGLKIQVGDVVIDRSLRGKLVEIKNAVLR